MQKKLHLCQLFFTPSFSILLPEKEKEGEIQEWLVEESMSCLLCIWEVRDKTYFWLERKLTPMAPYRS